MSAPSTYAIGTKYGVKGNMWAAGHHTGVDFLSPTGKSIKAPVRSKIIFAGRGGWGQAYGIHVIGEGKGTDGKTYRWIVAHLEREIVTAGQVVERGKVLGYSDSTGNVTGPHCHFEVRHAPYNYGDDVNPTVLLGVTGTVSTDRMDPAAYFLGAHGEHVTWLGERLIVHLKALGITPPYKSGAGPTFTATDMEAVRDFQLAQGWRGDDADGLPGAETLKRLAAAPKPTRDPYDYLEISTSYINGAGYDTVGKGKATAVARVPELAEFLIKDRPMFIAGVEMSAPMLAPMDKQLPGYARPKTSSGSYVNGKGRALWYDTRRGIKIDAVSVRNVKHMLDNDTKEVLLVAWTLDGFEGVTVVYHNENQGSTVQLYQMADVLDLGVEFAKAHGRILANILWVGDGNEPEVTDWLPKHGCVSGAKVAKVKVGEEFKTTNGWRYPVAKGEPIDIFALRANNKGVASYANVIYRRPISDHNGARLKHTVVKVK